MQITGILIVAEVQDETIYFFRRLHEILME